MTVVLSQSMGYDSYLCSDNSSHYCKKYFMELFDREFVIILYLALWQQTRTKYVQSFQCS